MIVAVSSRMASRAMASASSKVSYFDGSGMLSATSHSVRISVLHEPRVSDGVSVAVEEAKEEGRFEIAERGNAVSEFQEHEPRLAGGAPFLEGSIVAVD